MAERRMFAKTIIDSDMFLDMPLSTQALYFHLSMRADDDGFINNPRKIQRMVGASDDDLKILVMKRFILPFDSGVVVIKHWKIHNYIRNDRYKETVYQDEKNQLMLKENGAYTELPTPGIPDDNQVVYQMETQVRLGKDRLGEVRVGEDREEDVPDINVGNKPPKAVRHKYGMYEQVLLTDEDYEKLKAEFPRDYSERITRLDEYIASTGKKYKNHLATIRNWAKRDVAQRPAKAAKNSNPFLDMLEEGDSEYAGGHQAAGPDQDRLSHGIPGYG